MAGITVAVTHSKVLSGIPDEPIPNEVHPSDWNATHGVSVTGQNERTPAQAASVNILTTDIEVGIDTSGGAVTVNLPSAASWAAANPFSEYLFIQDRNGGAASNNITPALNGGDTFRNGVTPVVTASYGSLKLRPIGNPVTGWSVEFAPDKFADLSGNISVSQMNGGTNASASTFWRGDGAWVQPSFVSLSGSIAVNQMNGGTGADATKFWRGDGIWSALPGSFSGLANPAASIGLSAVNGAATTAMRSDAAPALSQAISPTWTGTHTWADAFGTVTLNTSSAVPQVQIERDATYNNENHAGLTVGSSSSPLKYLYLGYDTSIDAGFIQSINSTVAYKPLLLNPNGGNVGIGTTSPGLPLDVRGAAQAYALNGIGYVAPGVNGVAGNGVTDDTTAIQAILTAYTDVRIAPGTYLISSTLTINMTSIGHYRVRGAGAYYSHFVAKSSFTGTAAFLVEGNSGAPMDFDIGGFSIVNQTAGSGASYGLHVGPSNTGILGGNTKSRFFDIISSGFAFNFLQRDARMIVWQRCAAWNLDNSNNPTTGENGWYLFVDAASGTTFCGDTDFDACQTRSGTSGIGVTITDQGTASASLGGIRFRNHTFYNTFQGLKIAPSGAGTTIADVWVNPGSQFDGAVTDACIVLNPSASGATVFDIHVHDAYFSTANVGNHIRGAVSSSGVLENIIITGNSFENNGAAVVDIRGTGGAATGINVSHNNCYGNDSTGDMMYFENVTHLSVNGNLAFAANATASSFIYLASASDEIVACNNNAFGPASASVTNATSPAASHTAIANNI